MSQTPSPEPITLTGTKPTIAPSGRIVAIDGLRAAAILMVYTYHVWEFSGAGALRVGPISFGAIINSFTAGVDFFMVLSGFCLFWPIAKKGGSLGDWSTKDYAVRRIRRIVPPYYIAIVLMTFMPNLLVCFFRLLHRSATWQKFPSILDYLTHLSFTHTLSGGTWSTIQGSFWSLGLEAQFYLVFPLIVFGFRRFGIAVVVPMLTLSLIYRGLVAYRLGPDVDWTIGFLWSITFIGRWMQFATGMLAAWVVSRRASRPLSAAIGTTMVALAVSLFLATTSEYVKTARLFPLRDMVLATCFGLLAVAVCCSRTPLRRVFEIKPVVFLGFISYSVFLIHQNTIYYVSELLKKLVHVGNASCFVILMTLGLLLIVGLSYLFFRCFEAPFLAKPTPRPSRKSAEAHTASGTGIAGSATAFRSELTAPI